MYIDIGEQLHHAADHAHRHRRGDLRQRQRLRRVPAASGESRATRVLSCATAATTSATIKCPTAASRSRAMQMERRRLEVPRAQGRCSSSNVSRLLDRSGRCNRAEPVRRRSAERNEPANRKARDFDPATEQHAGIVLGIGVCGLSHGRRQRPLPRPARRRRAVTFPTAASRPKVISEFYTIVDFYESKMSEYDCQLRLRADPQAAESRGHDRSRRRASARSTRFRSSSSRAPMANAVRDKLRNAFPPQLYAVSTWRDKQGAAAGRRADGNGHPQRAAVPDHRRGRLRHPGDLLHDRRREDPRHRHPQVARRVGLAASWASSSATACRWASSARASAWCSGCCSSPTSTRSPTCLGRITGQPVFDPSIYYFYKIPDDRRTVHGGVDRARARWASPCWPASCRRDRAARLHPVEALRYE